MTTSSKMSSAPNSSHSSRTAALKPNGTGRVPLSGPTGSTITAAVPPISRFCLSFLRSASRSLGKNSRVRAVAPNGMPLASNRQVPGTCRP